MIRIVDGIEAKRLLATRLPGGGAPEAVVRNIIQAIKTERDGALLYYAREFDGLGDRPLRVSQEELASAAQSLKPDIRHAAETAIANIRQFAESQLPRETLTEFSPGRKLGWIVRPLDSVGCYVPSGRYPLPSTLLMTAVLAQIAGVPRICVTSPKPSTEILGCAHLLGLTEVYRVGGAQAIAALAYGTGTILPVDRIVGPGNSYVATAKRIVSADVGIDFVAGPTEILILAADGDPRLIAADMLAQAEHDITASAVLLTISQSLAVAVSTELERQIRTLPTADIARSSIDHSSFIAVLPSIEEAVTLTNMIAPEHLSLHDPALLPKIQNAGTIFLGATSPESAGDYASGPSHVLPTGGAARLRGGLSTADFVKVIAVQQLSPAALQALAPTITALARAEGLEAHARAVEVRSVR
ncbi:MAG TPA: histidinol dehydrogenase [Bryobacteraceae bacterium]|jgi:histidinol dehydrogenase|nr:histidinol dehydrogenase [Bryobacteraceae bacterium]